jgi:hypothetical protein
MYPRFTAPKFRATTGDAFTAHEIIRKIHTRKTLGLVFNIDYEKAYDKVNLDFPF